MNIQDFDRDYRFRMVQAYPVISAVPDAYKATHDEIDAGFARCLMARNLRRTHELYLAEADPMAGQQNPGSVVCPWCGATGDASCRGSDGQLRVPHRARQRMERAVTR